MKIEHGFLVLRNEATQLTLDPQGGGTIREFSVNGRDIFRRTPAGAGDDPSAAACFPMVPFVNRIAGGRFSYGGHTVHLARNWSEDPHPLHGQGWRAPWSVIEESATEARLSFEGGADEWPWRYRCEQDLELVDDGLSIELAIENLSPTAMPAMLGLHPCFADALHAQLQAQLPRVWTINQDALPILETPTPSTWSFESPRAVTENPLDNCFSGWNGNATLRWPDMTVTIRSINCSHLQIYSSARRDFFCVEPQSAATGAFNRNRGEVTVVSPGKRFAIQVHFSVGMSEASTQPGMG